jgi:hypothetical protein
MGVPGFWVAATVGMFVATAGIAIYFLIVSSPERARMRATSPVSAC